MMNEVIRKCSYENWYHSLKDYTLKSHVIEMPEEFKEFLLHEDFIINENQFPDLERKVNEAIRDLGGCAFPKLNFTAPTDALGFGFNHTLEVHSFHDLIYVLKGSTRVMIDISAPFNTQTEVKPYIVLKEFYHYRADREFRIFMKDRERFYVSSRNTCVPYSLDEDDVEELADKIVEKVSEKVHPTKLTIDIYISPSMKTHIIDIAPWSRVSSSLLFDWVELDHLDECEVRLSKDFHIRPKEDSAVPSDMLENDTLSQMIQSFREYERSNEN